MAEILNAFRPLKGRCRKLQVDGTLAAPTIRPLPVSPLPLVLSLVREFGMLTFKSMTCAGCLPETPIRIAWRKLARPPGYPRRRGRQFQIVWPIATASDVAVEPFNSVVLFSRSSDHPLFIVTELLVLLSSEIQPDRHSAPLAIGPVEDRDPAKRHRSSTCSS